MANGDFYLASTSPCINAGDRVASVSADFDGDVRPLGAGYDIGIDETLRERVIRYGYDPLGRLITATYSTGERHEYDFAAAVPSFA